MNLDELNNKIENSDFYKFLQQHRRIILIIQGLIIIGLLIGINFYFIQDWQIKKQIKERCGYVDSTYECVCEKHYVDDWKSYRDNLMEGNIPFINSKINNSKSNLTQPLK